MQHSINLLTVYLLSLILLFTNSSLVKCHSPHPTVSNNLKTYIVQVEPPQGIELSSEDYRSWYYSFLPDSVLNSEESRITHTYTEVFSGFAAKLTENEVKNLANKKGFVRAIPDRKYSLLTTHTPSFLGLQQGEGLWKDSNLGKGVIIGIIDSGVFPTHPSFSDVGIGPIPAKWKGQCNFPRGCNKKIIGSRNLVNPMTPAYDVNGHGTHISSTAVGNFVSNVSAFDGLGSGVASGVAPLSHLAVYKACDGHNCQGSAILNAIDAAVKDGVDVLSLSLGIYPPARFSDDPVAIGTYTAMAKGIVVVCAAGNSGPRRTTVGNDAPWILTVAATSVDRKFGGVLKLGNGQELYGESLNLPKNFRTPFLPLDYNEGYFHPPNRTVRGSIPVRSLDHTYALDVVSKAKEAGAAGLVFINYVIADNSIVLNNYQFNVVTVSRTDGAKIAKYAKEEANPTISLISNGTFIGASPAPCVAYFSSRGPSIHTPSILKPDISAPGVNILAGWTGDSEGSHGKYYNIVSGTSMATPHVSGIVALIKSAHPDWSPAAIKSYGCWTYQSVKSS